MPSSFGEVSVWGGSTGFSDVAANWTGGILPAPEDTIMVNAGQMSGRGLTAVLLNVAAGAEVFALAEGGAGITLNSPSALDPQTIAGSFFVGNATSPGQLTVNGGSYFTGLGYFRMTNPLSVIDGPGQFIMGQGLDLAGQGIISSDLYANGPISANLHGGTLTIASPSTVTMTWGRAINGGTLRIAAPAVQGITTLGPDLELITSQTVWDAQPDSEIIFAPSVGQLNKPRLVKIGNGAITFEGTPTLQQAAFSGDFTLPGFLIVNQTLDLRALGGLPAGKLTFSDPASPDSGLLFHNDWIGDCFADGPTRILGGEIILKNLGGYIQPLRTFCDSGGYGLRLEGTTVRGRGTVSTGFDLATFDSKIVADNPANEVVSEATVAARTLEFLYFNLAHTTMRNSGVLGAVNGGILLLEAREITNYADGGAFPNGVPHPQGLLEANGNSRIELLSCQLIKGSVLLPDAASTFDFQGGQSGYLSGGDGVLAFDGPGRFQVSGQFQGQMYVTQGTTLSMTRYASNISGDVRFNGPGIYFMNGVDLVPAGIVTDTLTVNGNLRGAGGIYVPVSIGPAGTVYAVEVNSQSMQINSPVTNRGAFGTFPGSPMLIANDVTVQNTDGGIMNFQGPVELHGRIMGGVAAIESNIEAKGGTLENVRLDKVGAPVKFDVNVQSITLRGTIGNNAVIRALDNGAVYLDGPVTLTNLTGKTGRLELGNASFISYVDNSGPKLTLESGQTLLAKKSAGDTGELKADIYVPIDNGGSVGADGMVLELHVTDGLTGDGKLFAINGGEIKGITFLQRVGMAWQRVVEVIGGVIRINVPNGLNIANANVQATGLGGLLAFNTGGNNIVALGGGNLVGLNGSNVVANGGGNIVAVGGGNIVAVGGGNIVGSNAGALTAGGLGAAAGVAGVRNPRDAGTAGISRILLGDGSTLTAGRIEIQNNGLLEITAGDPNADVEHFVLPPDTISHGNVEGTFDLQTGGAWVADVGGTVARQTYDQLVVTGAAVIAGELRVRIRNGFHQTIQAANTFTILTATEGITGLPSNAVNGRIATIDKFGTFAISITADTLGLVLSDFQALPHPIIAWAAGYGLTGANAQMSADPDRDGRNNLEEYALLTNPANGREVPDMPIQSSGGQVVISFVRLCGESHRLSYAAEFSATLGAWSPLAAPWQQTVTPVNNETERVTISGPASAARAMFRMKVTGF